MAEVQVLNAYPPNIFQSPQYYQPMINTWYDEADSSVDNQQVPSTRKRKQNPIGFSRGCCLTIGLISGFLIVAGAIIAAAIAAGTLTRSTSAAPSTTTTTTAAPLICNFSCVNQSWISSSNLLADWSFDGVLSDQTTNFNATAYNSPSFITNGYVNQALSFNASRNQSIYTSFIPITNSSFTVNSWIYPTGYPNIKDHSILGLCFSRTTSMCLHLTIRNVSSSYRLYMGFMNNDCASARNVSLNTWIHIGFVFDLTTMRQSVYIDGVLDQRCTAQLPIMVTTGSTTIGTIPVLAGSSDNNVFQGYMDEFTVSKRHKSTCEILEVATLAARFPFDSGSILVDYGPNSVTTSASSFATISSGHSLQAISFTGSSSSYFQASGFTKFGLDNQPFSISLWIQPQSLSGSLVHLSTSSNGAGIWCKSLLGFASNGSLVAQIYDGSIRSVVAPTLLPLSSSWSQVTQTWSPTNGLRLYVNNVLVASQSSATTFLGTGMTTNYVTLANGLSAPSNCVAGTIGVLGPFRGAIDDFRIYTRELTAADVCALYSN